MNKRNYSCQIKSYTAWKMDKCDWRFENYIDYSKSWFLKELLLKVAVPIKK